MAIVELKYHLEISIVRKDEAPAKPQLKSTQVDFSGSAGASPSQ